MQNLLTDINPEFAVGEQVFITHFDIDANCYHMGKGPDCGRKWFEAHNARPFVSIDDVSEEMLHPSVLYFDVEDRYLDDMSFSEDIDYVVVTSDGPTGSPERYLIAEARLASYARELGESPEVTWRGFDAWIGAIEPLSLAAAQIPVNREVHYEAPKPAVPLHQLEDIAGVRQPPARAADIPGVCQ